MVDDNDDFLEVITGAGTDGKKKLETKYGVWLDSLKIIIGYQGKEPRCFSSEFKNRLWKANPVCAICNQKIENLDDSEIDHIEFYWRGGKTVPENARLTHRFCNRSRKRKDVSIKIRKNSDKDATSHSDRINEIELNIRDCIHETLSNVKNGYWDSSIPEPIRIQVSDTIKGEISRHPYEKDKFLKEYEKLKFCGIRDFRKIIFQNWHLFEKSFYSRPETEKHFNNLATYRNKDKHGMEMDSVTQLGGEAAMEWIGKILKAT